MFGRRRTFRLEHVGSASPHGGAKETGGPGGSGIVTGTVGDGTGVMITGGGVRGDMLRVGSGGCAVGLGEADGTTGLPHPARITAAFVARATAIASLRRARNDWLKI
jgi:hypothetical protein